MDVKRVIARLLAREDLGGDDARDLFAQIMQGGLTPAQIAAVLVALAAKGESVDEIEAAARTLRAHCLRLPLEAGEVVDVVGTGGDGRHTFNVSTAAALITAAAGAVVAKHGNRAQSGVVGAADVLEALGVRIDLSPQQVAACIAEVGFGFLFAPNFHPAMKHVAPVRREIGVRTIFNLLGPLASPVQARRQLLGVFSPDWLMPFARVLERLGSVHALVVCGRDGIDEISLSDATEVAELRDGSIRRYVVAPGDFGLRQQSLDEIQVDSREAAAQALRAVLAGTPGPCLDIALLNAGAALYVAGTASSISEGVAIAGRTVASGAAQRQLQRLVEVSNR